MLVGGAFTAYNGNNAAPNFVLRVNANGTLNDGTLAGLAYTWNNGATGPSITVSQPGDYQATATTTGNGPSLSRVARVSAPPAVAVQITTPSPLTLLNGASATPAATATVAGFNVAGSGFNGFVYALAVQPDGKVLVGGNFTAYNGNTAAPDHVLRLNPDGSLDLTFNYTAGSTSTGADGVVRALALQSDGKVLVGGDFTAYNGGTAPARLLRLTANGSLDASFNPGGAGAGGSVRALALQPDGRVLVGGIFAVYNGDAAAPNYVLRLTATGLLDTSFNPGGAGTSGGAGGLVFALAVQPNGRVLVGGDFTAYNGDAAAPDNVLRLTADGVLDNSFNPGGAGAGNNVSALAVQADGRVLVGGNFNTYNGAAAPACLLRLTADGLLDTGFNPGGTGPGNSVRALLVQANGRVLVGGSFMGYNNISAPFRVLPSPTARSTRASTRP